MVIASGTVGMRIPIRTISDSEGTALPVAIVVLTMLTTIGAALVEVTRFGNLAARAHISAAAAMHLADTGLDAYERGALAAYGTTRLRSPSGGATIIAEQVLHLRDSTVLVLVESRGAAPDRPDPAGLRTLKVVMRINPNGDRERVGGTLMEDF